MWLALAFLSAALLGFYDVFKKQSLKNNAVIPVLFLNTLFCSLIFLPFIVLSACGNSWVESSIFHVPMVGWGFFLRLISVTVRLTGSIFTARIILFLILR